MPRTLAVAEALADVLVAPLLLAYRTRLMSFYTGGQVVSLAPGLFGLLVRRAWYGATLAHCGRRLHVQLGTVIRHADSRIGDDCYLGEYNHIGLVDIASHFMSSPHVCILSGGRQHGFDHRDLPVRRQPGALRRVTIGEDVWAGAHATIAADVAAHSVIGAGAVVTKTFAEWSILTGVPAEVLRRRP